MAVAISDNRHILNEADATTGWTGTVTVYTADPDPVETTGSLGVAVSNETEGAYYSFTSTNLTGKLIYLWTLANGIMDNTSNGGIRIYVSDGTNTIEYHVGGSDKAGFRYSQASVGWQCFVIDADSPPTVFTTVAGTEASLSWSAITDIGVTWKTLAKALGGTENCFVDIIRHGDVTNGNDLIVGGGGAATQGTFLEMAVDDYQSTNQKAYGGIHEVASSVFGLQIPVTFGDSAGTTNTYFEDSDVTVVFEDRDIGTDKYFINVEGNATGTNYFKLGLKSGTDGGSNGVSLICPTGVGASFDASNVNLDTFGLYGCTVSGFSQGVTFGADTAHEVYATGFSGCAQVDPGSVQFANNSIVNTTDANGGILGNRDLGKISFTSDGTGHAIYITTPGTYAYSDLTFSGYGANDTTDAVVYNNSGGAVTINASGITGSLTVRNGTSATTTVNNNVSVTFTGMKDNTEVRVYKTLDDSVIDGIENATAGTTDDRSFTFSAAAGLDVYYKIFNNSYEEIHYKGYIIPASATSIPIAQRLDRNYNNP